jgi:hypothetical protein
MLQFMQLRLKAESAAAREAESIISEARQFAESIRSEGIRMFEIARQEIEQRQKKLEAEFETKRYELEGWARREVILVEQNAAEDLERMRRQKELAEMRAALLDKELFVERQQNSILESKAASGERALNDARVLIASNNKTLSKTRVLLAIVSFLLLLSTMFLFQMPLRVRFASFPSKDRQDFEIAAIDLSESNGACRFAHG